MCNLAKTIFIKAIQAKKKLGFFMSFSLLLLAEMLLPTEWVVVVPILLRIHIPHKYYTF